MACSVEMHETDQPTTFAKLPDSDVILVRVNGILNSRIAIEIGERALAFAKEQGCKKFLFDYREARVVESTTGIYYNPTLMVKSGFDPNMYQVAILYIHDEADYMFWETVARNKGYVARVFKRMDEALAWLSE